MSTYDRVTEQIFDHKKRIEHAVKVNKEIRKKCIEALKLCQLQIHLATKGSV